MVDRPSRLVLWKNDVFISSIVQCTTLEMWANQIMIYSFIFNLCFLTVHGNTLKVTFLMQSEFPVVLGYRHVPSECWELNYGIM